MLFRRLLLFLEVHIAFFFVLRIKGPKIASLKDGVFKRYISEVLVRLLFLYESI